MQEGLYESLVTQRLASVIAAASQTAELREVDEAQLPAVVARHVAAIVESTMRATPKTHRVEVANEVLRRLAGDEAIVEPPSELLRMVTPTVGAEARYAVRPSTSLNDAALLTNVSGEPSLGSELRLELASADEVDLLCAFVKWPGLRVLEGDLRAFRDRGGRLRVITTTYMGATDRVAVDRLVRDFGAEVRVHYNEATTRLHAKAWLFRRYTGWHTAYVGSSNLSRSALLDGLEWNVRLSAKATPHLLEKFTGTFDTYWNDPTFEPYDPDDVDQRDRLDDALASARGYETTAGPDLALSGLEVRPYAFQQHILDALQAERELHGRHRNLVVAATGTGKTIMAALDYRRLADPATKRYPSLLFVAHRKEILQQSLRTYREVLADASFGELYVDGTRPERFTHVFASVQSLNSYGVRNLPVDAFDVVVIDEFHHAAARSYQALLDHLQPRELLALTATPERTDGFDVRAYFEGRTAAELRLWEALQAGLLCPFHYFMIADGTDLSSVAWVRGRYDEGDLQEVYTGNEARTRIILRALKDKVLEPGQMRALGFCVGVAHAQYMARAFTQAGIPARAVTGQTPREERRQALSDLREGTVNILFTADLFNEGIDVPDVDTILFLRPTESATVFLQQLGRGLRQSPGKSLLTVLDFVGHQRQEFRFDAKLAALTGQRRGRLKEDTEAGFPYLPSGSQIVLDEQSQEIVLTSLRRQIDARWPALVRQLKAMGQDTTLPEFLDEAGVTLPQVIRQNGKVWTTLRRDAGHLSEAAGPNEGTLARRVRALAHVDDDVRYAVYRRLLAGESPEGFSNAERRVAEMLYFSLWPDGGKHQTLEAGLASLAEEPALVQEMMDVVALAFEHAERPVRPLEGDDSVPLRVHARYQREEILAALGFADTGSAPNSVREGVRYLRESNIDVFFITLRKSEERFTPTTMYRDYPLSRELFHWESQSTTSVDSPTGQRYLSGSSRVLLFAREEQKGDMGTEPYVFLGRGRYVSHTGNRPIAITWKLDVPLPADLFAAWSVAATA